MAVITIITATITPDYVFPSTAALVGLATLEFEALASLACHCHENPADAFPELEAGRAQFVAEEVGHPLLALDVQRVPRLCRRLARLFASLLKVLRGLLQLLRGDGDDSLARPTLEDATKEGPLGLLAHGEAAVRIVLVLCMDHRPLANT